MTATLRVTHLVPALFDRDEGIIGGAERYAFELARHMAHEVPTELVTFGHEDRTSQEGDLMVRVLGRAWHVRGQASNPFSLRLFRALRRATVLHCHQQHIVASSAAAAYARLSGRTVFVSDLGGGGWDISRYVSTDRWYHGHLHISAYSRQVVGHDANPRAHVIYGGVDTTRFSPAASPTERPSTVLFVGRLLSHKGVDDLVDALPDGLSLEIIGNAYDDAFLADLKRAANGRDVTFTHDADDAKLVAAYRRALCVVLPSVYNDRYGRTTKIPELLGQTPLEGMACGIPAIVTSVASLPEVVRDGVTGFVVPPNNPTALQEKLCWLRDHPSEVRSMGDAARRWVLERFTWDTVVRRCLEIYTAAGAP